MASNASWAGEKGILSESASDCTVQCLTSIGDVRCEAPELAEPAPSQSFFGTLPWFEILCANGLDRAVNPYMLLVKKGDKAIMLLPVIGRVGLTALSNFYSSLFEPVWSPECDFLECLRACREYLQQNIKRWPFVDFQPLEEGGAFALAIARVFEEGGYWTDEYFCFGNWYLEVAGRSYPEYFVGLPSNLRHNITRGQARLSRHGSWQVRIIVGLGPDLDWALRSYTAVYQSSWKQPEPFPDFIDNFCRMGAGQGWLRLGVLTLDEKPIAAQIWMTKDGTASIYKLAYDNDFSRFSPGSVLTSKMMEYAIDSDGVQLVDYLTGDDPYKKDWMSHRRERIGVVAFNPGTARGLIMGTRHFSGRWIKRQLERLR